MRNFADKFQRYGQFTASEIKGLILTIVVVAFILSFRDWGKETFDFFYGLSHFFLTIILVAIAFLARQLAHRASALSVGYKVEFRAWTVGLVVGLILSFVSNGTIPLLATGGIFVTHLAVHRLGRFRYGLGYHVVGWIALAGAIANI